MIALAGVGAASAADLAPRYAKAPPMVAAASSWTGCYAGGNIGAGWQHTAVTDVDPSLVGTGDAGADTGTGVVGGGQVGCDYQFAPNWVAGVQGMFDGTNVRGSHFASAIYAGDPFDNFASHANWFGTLTARLGYAVMPQTLFYVKGGVAWLHNDYRDVDSSGLVNPPYVGQASATRTGWTIGGGGEYMFTPNWSVFAEYDYAGFGSKTLAFTYNCGAACGFNDPYLYSQKQNFQTVLVGINYRWGGPIVARY